MEFSKDIKEYYKVLDNIISSLFKSKNHSMLKSELLDKIKKENFVFIDKNIELSDDVFDKEFEESQFDDFFEESLIYLKDNAFILQQHATIKLTFQGIIQHSEGFVNTLENNMRVSQRIQTLEDEQVRHNGQMANATDEMNKTNKGIRSLTFWIMIAALFSILYQLVEILKTFFPSWFCNSH